MRAMKDSGVEWIGEIPQDWEVVKIKNLSDSDVENAFVDGNWIESPYIVDEGIKYLTTGNIGDGKYKEQGNGYITYETFVELNCRYAYPGDLVFSRLNSPYGRSCILPDNFSEYVLAVDNVILRTKYNKKFLCYVTQCSGYQREVEDNSKGTTMKRISRTVLGNMKMPLPKMKQQQNIADYLDSKCSKIDTIIEKQQAVIEKLKEYRLSVITEAVTKGLNPDVEMKDSGVEWIGLLPKDWTIKKLKMIVSTTKGYAFNINDFARDGISVIKVSDIKNGTIRKGESFISENDLNKFLSVMLYEGDILMTTVGSNPEVINSAVGQLAKVPKEFAGSLLNQNVVCIRTNKDCSTNYLYYFLSIKRFREHLNLIAHGTANQSSISLKDILSFVVILPSVQTQEDIAKFLDDKCAKIENSILNKQKVIEKLKDYKKSLIYEVVTGKKEV